MMKYFLLCLLVGTCQSFSLAALEKEHGLAQKRFDVSEGMPKSKTPQVGVSLFGKPVKELNVPQAMATFAVQGGVGGMVPGQIAGAVTSALYTWKFLSGWNFVAAVFLGAGLGGIGGLLAGGVIGALIGLGVGLVNKCRRLKAR